MTLTVKISHRTVLVVAAVAVAVFGFSSLRALSVAKGISEPIEFRLRRAAESPVSCFTVYRLTRTGGNEMLDTQNVEGGKDAVYRTEEWTSGLAIQPTSDSCRLESVMMTVGGDSWQFTGHEIDKRAAEAFVALLLFYYALALFTKKSGSRNSSEQSLHHSRWLLTCLLGAALSLVSILVFFRINGSAFEWPAMDMAPFWSRYFNPDFAVNSFFTDASMLPNPRWPFGYVIIVLAEFFHVHWYSIVFALRVLFTLSVPVVIFFSLNAVLTRKVREEATRVIGTLVLFGFVISALSWKVNSAFALALWSPLVLSVQPETLSLFFAFSAMWLFFRKREVDRGLLLTAGLLFLATLMHPVRSFYVFAFFVIADHNLRLWREYLVAFTGGIVIPTALLALSFPVQNPLTAEQFVYHYIKQNHDFHYLPSNFGAVNGIPWFVVFALVALPLVVGLAVGVFKRNRQLKWTAGLFMVAYCLSILAEYLFIEVTPIKLFAIITPVRFTSLGYWMVALVLSWIVAEYAVRPGGINYVLPNWLLRRRRALCVGLILGVVAIGVWAAVCLRDDPWRKHKSSNSAWTEWLESSTRPGEVFATNILSVASQLTIIHDRASFLGNGFSFREDDFVEYDERKDSLFGSYAQWEKMDPSDRPPYWAWSKDEFRKLTPHDFVQIARKYRIDYVIVENDHAAAFDGVPVEYENDIFKVYKVADF